MRTIHAERDRQVIVQRIRALDERRPAAWGSFTAPRMIAHLSDSARMALGELTVAPIKSPLRLLPIRKLIIYVAPFPKGAPTAPELIARAPMVFRHEVATLLQLLERVGARDARAAWPEHPAFGPLTGADWGTLVHRHCDHHLRQFSA